MEAGGRMEAGHEDGGRLGVRRQAVEVGGRLGGWRQAGGIEAGREDENRQGDWRQVGG